jgi:hypothetical protein
MNDNYKDLEIVIKKLSAKLTATKIIDECKEDKQKAYEELVSFAQKYPQQISTIEDVVKEKLPEYHKKWQQVLLISG